MQTLKWFRVLTLAAAIFLLCGEVVLARSGNLIQPIGRRIEICGGQKRGKAHHRSELDESRTMISLVDALRAETTNLQLLPA